MKGNAETESIGGRILVVDDEAPLRRALSTSLRARGFEVIEASSGEQGVVVVADQACDLVVLDLGLGDIEGLEVLHGADGWRTFTLLRPGEKVKNTVLCPASAEAGYKTNCDSCGLCNGKRDDGDKRKSVFIAPHGIGRRNAPV